MFVDPLEFWPLFLSQHSLIVMYFTWIKGMFVGPSSVCWTIFCLLDHPKEIFFCMCSISYHSRHNGHNSNFSNSFLAKLCSNDILFIVGIYPCNTFKYFSSLQLLYLESSPLTLQLFCFLDPLFKLLHRSCPYSVLASL
jgi:hypothetical protein